VQLFCANDKKKTFQKTFSYEIFAVSQKSFKEFAGNFALFAIHFLLKFDEIDARLFTIHFHLVSTCDLNFQLNYYLGMNLNPCRAHYIHNSCLVLS
jgi:hypothetical protein